MSPLRRKKIKKKKSSGGQAGLLRSKWWLVLAAALVCVLIIATVSFFTGGRYQDIFYNPRGEETTIPVPGQSNVDGDAPPPPGQITLPREYQQPAPVHLSSTEKEAFIQKKYTIILEGLDDYYRWELRRLLAAGYHDYQAVKSGHMDRTMSQLAGEYVRLGRSLEKEADQSAAAVFNQMKSELKDNNLSLDLVKMAEKEYNSRKSDMRNELLQTVQEYFHD